MEEATFTWKIENFSKLPRTMITSKPFVMYGHTWCLNLYHKGKGRNHFGFLLAVANPESLPSGWTICAELSLILFNQVDDTRSVTLATEYNFCVDAKHVGSLEFLPLSKLCDRNAGFLVRDALIVKAQIIVKPKLAITHTPLEDFATIFADISKVVAACPLFSEGVADSGPDVVEISHSLSLLKHIAGRCFSDIPCRLRAELRSALQVLTQAAALPPDQASAIADFSSQFEELCKAYVSNLAVLETTQIFFDLKVDTFLLMKTLCKSHMKIKNSIDKVSEETNQLQRLPGEMLDPKSPLLEQYAVLGKKAEGVKAEWDDIIAKEDDMVGRREKAKNEIAAIETKWTGFISLFKSQKVEEEMFCYFKG